MIANTGIGLIAQIQNAVGLGDTATATDILNIRRSIRLAEDMMRNLELPALRTDHRTTIGVANANGEVPIPADLNKVIFLYQMGQNLNNPNPTPTVPQTPSVVYNRQGDRFGIERALSNAFGPGFYSNFYGSVVKGTFSEATNSFMFDPLIGEGTKINLYYYRALTYLFSDTTEPGAVSGVVGGITAISNGYSATISNIVPITGRVFAVGDRITSLTGLTGGSLGSGANYPVVTSVTATSLTYSITGTSIGQVVSPVAGAIGLINKVVELQTNEVLRSFYNGYYYGTLFQYYTLAKSDADAGRALAHYTQEVERIKEQNAVGKQAGGSLLLTSGFLPGRVKNFRPQ